MPAMLSRCTNRTAQYFRNTGCVASFALFLTVVIAVIPASSETRFDLSGWKQFRKIQIPENVPFGVVGIPLESEIVIGCRPDLADLTVVSSEGMEVPCNVRSPVAPVDVHPFPVRIFRMARRPGKWTDLWVDKTAKVVTSGILFKTSARDFARCVEIRGSDNGKDEYVIRLDAMIADQQHPFALKSLQVQHRLNNFQYLHLRILDEGKPHVPINAILCYPPAPEDPVSVPLSAHMMENRVHPGTRSTVVVADLGERRYPVTEIAVDVEAERFVKKATIKCASSPTSEDWRTVFDGVFYRLKKKEAVKELSRARFDPQPYRHIKIELSGRNGAPVKVRKIDALGSMPMVLFRYTRGEEYSIYYNNPSLVKTKRKEMPFAGDLLSLLASSSRITLGPEQKIVPQEKTAEHTPPAQVPPRVKSNYSRLIGIAMLLVGLLLLFGLMLRSRSLRRRDRHRSSRILNVR